MVMLPCDAFLLLFFIISMLILRCLFNYCKHIASLPNRLPPLASTLCVIGSDLFGNSQDKGWIALAHKRKVLLSSANRARGFRGFGNSIVERVND